MATAARVPVETHRRKLPMSGQTGLPSRYVVGAHSRNRGGAVAILRTVRDYLSRHGRSAAVFIATLVFLVLHFVKGVTEFPYDSGVYWWLSDVDALRHYSGAMRGYFMPLLLSPARALSDLLGLGVHPYRIISSLSAAFVLAWVLPEYFVRVFGGRLSLPRRLVVPLLLALFMPGAIVYPLSDLPSVSLMICSASVLLLAVDSHSIRPAYGWAAAAGILAGAAYYTRPIYVAYVALALLAIPFLTGAKRPQVRVSMLALFAIGLVIASLPQVQSNVWSGLGPTPAVPSGDERYPGGIFAYQLWSGLAVQRYETELPPGASAYFIDPAGLELYRSAREDSDSVDVASYARLAARRPLAVAGVYARHAVNGLDLRDGDIYVKSASSPDRWVASVANFVILFVSAWIALIRARVGGEGRGDARALPAQSVGTRLWPVWLGLWVVPVAAILPGAIETRFFLPVYLLAWSAIAFLGDPRSLARMLKRHPLPIVVTFVAALAAFVVITSSALSCMQTTMPT